MSLKKTFWKIFSNPPGANELTGLNEVFCFQLVMGVCLYLLPALCNHHDCKIPALSVLLYMHGVMWFFVMLGDRYLRHQYNMIRIFGYLEFYRQNRNIRRVPFIVFSGGKLEDFRILSSIFPCLDKIAHFLTVLWKMHFQNELTQIFILVSSQGSKWW